MNGTDKPLAWLIGFSSPPMGREAVREAGFTMRQVQGGALLSLPLSRPMPEIGPHVHEFTHT